jgi:hypothetical protein
MLLTIAVMLGLVASGCSAITDFDKPKDAGADAGGLYSIDANLATYVEVTLQPTNTGEMLLQLTNPLPTADNPVLLGMLSDGTIDLQVLNEESLVSFNLTQGTQSESISLPGDYNISLNADRTQLTISFFNEIEGTSLYLEGNYLATITVNANNLFVAETFTRDVTMTGV